jgi:hypothetical protein
MRTKKTKTETPSSPSPSLKKVEISDIENTQKKSISLPFFTKEKPLNKEKLDDTAHTLQRLMRRKPDKEIPDTYTYSDMQHIKDKLKKFSITELEYLHDNFANYPKEKITNLPEKRSIALSKSVLATVLTDKLYKEMPHNNPEYSLLSEKIAHDDNILLPYGIGKAYKRLQTIRTPLNRPTPDKHLKNIKKRNDIKNKLQPITEKHDKYSQLKSEYGSNIEKIDKDIEASKRPSQGEARPITDLLSHITAPLTAPLVFLRLM